MALLPISSTAQSGELKVDANQINDPVGLKNTSNSALRVSFTASGQWCLYNVPTTDPELAIFNAQTDWKGMLHLGPKHEFLKGIPADEATYYKYKWHAFGQPAGSLIADVKDPEGATSYLVSSPTFIDLPSGCSAEFYMNDDKRWYGDNSGQITLTYTCAPITVSLPQVKKMEGPPPQGVFPDRLYHKLGMLVSYKGIDFYPLDFTDNRFESRLIGIKDGKVARVLVIRGHRIFQNIAIEPQTHTVRLEYINPKMRVLARIPWSSLSDVSPPQIISRNGEVQPLTTNFVVKLIP